MTGADAPRCGNAHPNLVPYELFHAADRSVAIAVGTDAQWLACTAALDLSDLAKDSALTTNAGRVHHPLFGGIGDRRSSAKWRGRRRRAPHRGGSPVGRVR